MMKYLFMFLSIGFGFSAIHAQQSQPKYLGSYTQPAPNAAALGKYVDMPVGYYTGTPSISVPLYSLQEGSIGISASLNYHASGIKVSEIASWCGLGWSINATGMITRSVRGGPDEGVANATVPGGYYKDFGITQMPLLPYPVGNSIPPDGADVRRDFLEQAAGGNTDGEPDLYIFNFAGYSGKFVFDENRNPRLLTQDNVKISVEWVNGSFVNWVITTPDGKQYYFGENSMHEVTRVFSNTSFEDPNSLRPSSWYLTKIVDPNTQDVVNFIYTPEVYSYYDLGQETKEFTGTTGPNSMTNACQVSELPSNVLRTTVYGLRLTNIQSSTFNIEFIADTDRQDLVPVAGQTTAKHLSKIKINHFTTDCSRMFTLNHGYFQSSTSTNLSTLVAGFVGGDISDTKRLKLLSVKETSCDLINQKAPYVFTYEEAFQLPRRLSYDQDHWGYSNNYSGNSNQRFTPPVQHPICTFFTGSFANRNAKWPDMQSYSLKTFKDPLGGLTSFEFESNVNYANTLIGGLRIKKITATDGVTGKSIVRKFEYPGGGIVYNMPQYLIIPQNEYYFIEASYSSIAVAYRGYNFNNGQYLMSVIRQSQSVVPMQDFNGNHIGYGVVKEKFGENGEGGYKIYNFKADQVVGGKTSSKIHMGNYTATASILSPNGNGQMISGIFGNGQFNNILPENLTYYQSQDVNNYYPFAPQQVEFGRGQLVREETFDATGNKIKEVYNQYQETYRENLQIRGFKMARSSVVMTLGNETSVRNNDAFTYYKLHTGISNLVSTIVKDFKDGKDMSSTTVYAYESPNHTLKTSETTTNSNGETVINNTFYSFDFENTATADNVFQKMKAKNMLLPIKNYTWRNGKMVAGTVTELKDFSTNSNISFINPSKIYAFENSEPVLPGAGLSIGYSGMQTNLVPNTTYFKPKASFTVSGTTGKVLEQQLTSDKTESLIWDNVLDLPIAKVDNAKFNDIAFTSFESAETGNWNYISGSVVGDATALTGSKAYSISGGMSKSGLNPATKYILSYWSKGGSVTVSGINQSNAKQGKSAGGWTYNEVVITNGTTVTISGTGSIDEVRLYPASSLMSTYCYDLQKRMVSAADINNMVLYYEYDGLGRLLAIRDFERNIVKIFEYNYGALNR